MLLVATLLVHSLLPAPIYSTPPDGPRRRLIRAGLFCNSIQSGWRRMADAEARKVSRVLIADDNEQNCELLEAYLDDGGIEIAMAFDGQETIEKVAEFEPDLILLDIMMPRMSGYEVCQKLKSDSATRDIPILMVTALNEMGDIEKAVNAGCDDFLTKPVNRLELTTRVKSLLRVRHLTSERDRLLAYLSEVERSEADSKNSDE
jgi:two-component system, OmpR family, alkaline phosphatase synthesis response regulator PhoP